MWRPARRPAAARSTPTRSSRAGGVPVLLPPVADAGRRGAPVVARLDGLVVAGGADVDPARYGERAAPAHRRAGAPDRDAWELALLDAADAVGLPVLGVCRGMQVMAVHAGGTLDQHTPDVVGHDEHSPGGDVVRRDRRCATVAGHPAGRGWSASALERQLPPPPVGARRTPASRPSALGRRRHAGGDGGRRRPLLRRPCSGTPRPPPTSACSPGWSGPPRSSPPRGPAAPPAEMIGP